MNEYWSLFIAFFKKEYLRLGKWLESMLVLNKFVFEIGYFEIKRSL